MSVVYGPVFVKVGLTKDSCRSCQRLNSCGPHQGCIGLGVLTRLGCQRSLNMYLLFFFFKHYSLQHQAVHDVFTIQVQESVKQTQGNYSKLCEKILQEEKSDFT